MNVCESLSSLCNVVYERYPEESVENGLYNLPHKRDLATVEQVLLLSSLLWWENSALKTQKGLCGIPKEGTSARVRASERRALLPPH